MSAPPLRLTLPTDGAASTRLTAKRFLKKVARDTLRVTPALVGDDLAAVAGEVHRLVRGFGDARPGALYGVLRRPHVHVLLTTAIGAAEEGQAAAARDRARAYLFQLLGELALEGLLPAPVTWPAPPPVAELLSPARRVVMPLPGDAPAVAFEPGAVRVGAARLPFGDHVSDLYVPVAPGMVLALRDNNPISDFEAHPDKQGNQLDLGDAPASRWADALGEALAVIGRHLPEIREEMGLLLQQLVPVGTDDQRHLSASYREAIGTVYLTLHPMVMTMAEAVVHEYQHNKINMLFHLDATMDNAFWPLYPSPVRPDPRPLHGVLLAAHAFVPVAEMYRRMIDAGAPEARSRAFHERFRQVVAKNGDALAVLLAHAEPTAAGREVLDELAAWHAEHAALVA